MSYLAFLLPFHREARIHLKLFFFKKHFSSSMLCVECILPGAVPGHSCVETELSLGGKQCM